jgi:hypothetical protein
MPDSVQTGMSRRGMLISGASVLGAATLGTVGSVAGSPAAPALAHGGELPYSTIWNQATFYENLETGAVSPATFWYDPTFHSQLDTWLANWYTNTPSNWITPIQVMCNGVHVDGQNTGWHNYGRAIDISRINIRNSSDGTMFEAFFGRYDIWRNWTGTNAQRLRQAIARRRYWGTVASLNRYFGVVVNYLSNAEHHNHIHADNSEPNTFNGTRSQILMVQAVCTYVWGYPTTTDGFWGGQTDGNSRSALARMGRSGGITTSTANWHAFCTVSLAQATGDVNL